MKVFSKRVREACEEALDAQRLCEDEFFEFVVERMGGFDGTPLLLRQVSVSGGEVVDQCVSVIQLVADVKLSVRGTYGLVEHVRGDGGVTWLVVASHGPKLNDARTYFGLGHRRYETPPDGSFVAMEMLRGEVFACRQVVMRDRARRRAREALKEYPVSLGQEFSDYMDGCLRRYSKATVTCIYQETGEIEFCLTRRGSAYRQMVRITADDAIGRIPSMASMSTRCEAGGTNTSNTREHAFRA